MILTYKARGGAVVRLSLLNKKVLDSNLAWHLSVWCLHVLSVSDLIFSMYSGFLDCKTVNGLTKLILCVGRRKALFF